MRNSGIVGFYCYALEREIFGCLVFAELSFIREIFRFRDILDGERQCSIDVVENELVCKKFVDRSFAADVCVGVFNPAVYAVDDNRAVEFFRSETEITPTRCPEYIGDLAFAEIG